MVKGGRRNVSDVWPPNIFLDASSHLCKWVCLSVRPSVRPSRMLKNRREAHRLASIGSCSVRSKEKTEFEDTSCWNTVSSFLTNDRAPPGELQSVLNNVHTQVVE